MPIIPKVAAIVLAAGFSSRMGEFKPLLPLAGASLIGRVAVALHQAGVEDVIVVTGHRAAEMTPELTRYRLRHTVNEGYADGMYSSVQAGVRALAADAAAFFLWPVDVPLVRSHSLRLLLRDFRQHGAAVTYPMFRGERGHPPLIAASLIPMIREQERPEGLRGLLAEQEMAARDVELIDEGVVADMDTPDDYAKLKQWADSRGIPTPAECEEILARWQPPAAVVRHSRLVANVAADIAAALNRKGMALNPSWVKAAGLLHDMAKAKTRRHHARIGARMLCSLGFPAVAGSVAMHMDFDYAHGERLNETAVVYLADKLVQCDRLVPIDERFAPAWLKYPPGHELYPMIFHRFIVAKTILSAVEEIIGVPITTILSETMVNGRDTSCRDIQQGKF